MNAVEYFRDYLISLRGTRIMVLLGGDTLIRGKLQSVQKDWVHMVDVDAGALASINGLAIPLSAIDYVSVESSKS